MELVVAQPVGGEAFCCRHFHRPAEGTGHTKAHVVNKDDDHVRCPLGHLYLEARWRCGITGIEYSALRVVWFGERQYRSIE